MKHLENSGPPGGPSRLAEPAKSSAQRDPGDNLTSNFSTNSLLPLSEHVDRPPTTGATSTLPASDGPLPRANHDGSRCRLALPITV